MGGREERTHNFNGYYFYGGGKKGILLCDSNCELWGKTVCGNEVLPLLRMQEELQDIALDDVVFLITIDSVEAQDEVINDVEMLYGKLSVIYTAFAIEWGIYFNLKNSHLNKEFRDKKMIEHKEKRKCDEVLQMGKENAFRYFAFLPLHNDEIILIYQPGKVASSTLYKSITRHKRYALHCHVLNGIGESDDELYELLNKKSGKIISLVRDPIARRIAEMWQNIDQLNRYSSEVDFSEIEKFYFPDTFSGGEFEWFDGQLNHFFKINVFEHPFDKEKGYSIIRKDNIELLLIKMEKLNELESVIGDFLNISNFQLSNNNVGDQKPYRFAYREYKMNLCFSEVMLENVYKKNEHIKHFYSEQERELLYRKWSKKVEI